MADPKTTERTVAVLGLLVQLIAAVAATTTAIIAAQITSNAGEQERIRARDADQLRCIQNYSTLRTVETRLTYAVVFHDPGAIGKTVLDPSDPDYRPLIDTLTFVDFQSQAKDVAADCHDHGFLSDKKYAAFTKYVEGLGEVATGSADSTRAEAITKMALDIRPQGSSR
jgi:hypothetical protein